jgi:hypothetical protein
VLHFGLSVFFSIRVGGGGGRKEGRKEGRKKEIKRKIRTKFRLIKINLY